MHFDGCDGGQSKKNRNALELADVAQRRKDYLQLKDFHNGWYSDLLSVRSEQ